jgi:hypothetical protein
MRETEPARLSIVIKPLANPSGDPGQDYLSDALTDAPSPPAHSHAQILADHLGGNRVALWGSRPARDHKGKGVAAARQTGAQFRLCEQALAIDPNNVRGLMVLRIKFWAPAVVGVSGDPNGDLARAAELESKALVLNPDALGLTT